MCEKLSEKFLMTERGPITPGPVQEQPKNSTDGIIPVHATLIVTETVQCSNMTEQQNRVYARMGRN